MKWGLGDLWYIAAENQSILELIENRKAQLREQQNIDDQLREKCLGVCPLLVSRLLLDERKLNRESIEKSADGGNLENYIKSVQRNYDDISEHHKRLQTILKTSDPCRELETLCRLKNCTILKCGDVIVEFRKFSEGT